MFRVCEVVEKKIMKQIFLFLLIKKEWFYSMLLHDGIYLLKQDQNEILINDINDFLFYQFNYPFLLVEKDIKVPKEFLPFVSQHKMKKLLSNEYKVRFFQQTLEAMTYTERLEYYKCIKDIEKFEISRFYAISNI